MTDPNDEESELRIGEYPVSSVEHSLTLSPSLVTSLSSCTPANILGEVPSASDDVFVYKLFTGEQYSHGYIQMKRFAEKPKCNLGNNLLVSVCEYVCTYMLCQSM